MKELILKYLTKRIGGGFVEGYVPDVLNNKYDLGVLLDEFSNDDPLINLISKTNHIRKGLKRIIFYKIL